MVRFSLYVYQWCSDPFRVRGVETAEQYHQPTETRFGQRFLLRCQIEDRGEGHFLKILHVVPSYLPATRYGGPIRSVHGLARAQAARGHDVKVFTTNVNGPTVSPVPV